MNPADTLGAMLEQKIATHGPITFLEFMGHALYDPRWGYYSSGRATIGRSGDFFTSVSVGPLFGALIARQIAQMWQLMGEPAEFHFIEQGAHRGDFARDFLRALQAQDARCFAALRYVLVEPTATQRQFQQQTLAEFSHLPLQWVQHLEELPAFVGIHFSNELLDAFPVHRARWNGEHWEEQYVNNRAGQFQFQSGPLSSPALAEALAQLPGDRPEGYICEINLAARHWAQTLASKLLSGYVLAIDYGWPRDEYFRTERSEGTLSAYANHQRVKDPLADPGQVDLTAHVDFTAVTQSAEAAGLRLAGFTDQHHFMVGLSQLHFADTQTPSAERAREIRAFKTLMHPTLLGQSFKILCLEKAIPHSGALAGLSYSKNSRETLGL